MLNRIQSNTNQPSFKAWLDLRGATELISKKCTREIREAAEKIGDPNDMIDIHISKDTFVRDNSWSEMRCRFTVPESVRSTYMNAIINGEHFNKGFETKDSLSSIIGTEILKWLEKLPRYED